MSNSYNSYLTEPTGIQELNLTDATIFVVDDDNNVRKGLSRLLRAHQFNVETFASAKEFLARGIFSARGCVLLDYHMPVINGIELQAEMIRSGIDLPVIFLTGKGDIPTTVIAIKQGAVDFLVKPVDEKCLFDAIDKGLAIQAAGISKRTSSEAITACLNELTIREREVLNLVIQGFLNKQIAFELGIAEKTVKAHRGRVMEKMKAKTIADLVHKCDAITINTSGSIPD